MSMAYVTNQFTYDVFLSFRGEDTRHSFTGNLWKALKDRGVHTFIDDEELRKGKEITPSLIKAIEDSNMAIIVLSKNYASSSFCLQELSMILDSIKDKDRLVWPVFYEVDPSDVRKLTGSYGEAMAKHEMGSNCNNDILQKWKNALNQVANFSGFHFKKGDAYEHVFIEKIVDRVSREIIPVTLHVPDYLVGLEYQKKNVISLLNVGSDDTVHMVGIHGIGGIGKTTLALEVYNSIVRRFHDSCFLENVRENSDKNGLIYLQKILLSQIFGEKNIELTSVRQGISILERRLQQKKVLLFLDDVDKEEQLNAIAGSSDWFGRGSRVIITTRDKGLLNRHGVERIYEVKGLNDDDAFELVIWKAFKKKFSPSYKDVLLVQNHGSKLDGNALLGPKSCKNKDAFVGYVDVLKRAVEYASGLPLALEVISSHFFNKTIEQCKDTLGRYERIQNKKIQTILQISFDTLQEEEKFVFLDIACCFKGWKLTRVEQILHAHHGDIMKDHINVLVEKSLIKIDEYGIVTLHDLIEDMGKEMVRRESPEDPGKRSRLWASVDINKVLKENTGTSKIEIIHFERWVEVDWDGEAFKKMENLKTLIFRNHAGFPKNPKHLPNSLRVLEWCRHPSSDLFSRYDPMELSIRYFSYCHSSSPLMWKGFFTKKFQSMKVLNFEYGTPLAQIPDISGLPNLEEFSIQNCVKLIAIDKSVGFLGKLKILRFKRCTEIKSIPPLSLASLEELDLSHCCSLESFPSMVNGFVGELKILRVISCTKIEIIPSLMLTSLEELDLSDCTSLEEFSPVVDGFGDKLKTMSVRGCINLRCIPPLKLDSLETLDLSCCSSLECFPEKCNSDEHLSRYLMLFANVEELHLTENRFTVIPECIEKCHFLWKLVLDDCKELKEINGIPPSLKIVSALNCTSLTSSCKSKLLNQELHEAGKTWFRFPRAKIPEWFDHQRSGEFPFSFWFHNKFPAIVLCVLSPLTWSGFQHRVRVIINGNTFFYTQYGSKIDRRIWPDTYHLHLFHMQMENFNDNMDIALLENKWNHAEVDFGFSFLKCGIHVLKEKSNMKDIRFTNPENDDNIVLLSGC